MDIICIYRFSDSYQTSPDGQVQNKTRPTYFNKRKIFINFLNEFGSENTIVVADNVSDESIEFLSKHISSNKIIRTDYKNGALSFLYSAEYIIDNYKNDETIVYFVEDDYIHKPNSKKVLLEGAKISDYVTLYDHPDKYGGNPYVIDGGERTILYLTDSLHWKITNSTTMTFATKINILKQDYLIYRKHCHTGYPHDFEMFLELGKYRKLISSVPGYSTHCENGVITPLYDWNNLI